MRALILLVTLFLTQSVVLGQRASVAVIKGIVMDSTSRQPLEAATVSAYLASDTTMLSYTITDKSGRFTVKNLPRNERIKLVVSYSGLRPFIDEIIIPVETKELLIKTIGLSNETTILPEVLVSAIKPPFVLKKDTLEFNASAFKTSPNSVVEDLLRQLPGVEVDMDGNITVNGKRVTKITVDGKDFFGSDVKLTTKNLPKDIIERIQVVDLKTREEKFNNSRNPSQEKSINIVLRKENKKGIFGRASAALGSKNRFEAGGNINLFNAKHQVSLIGFGNNTNTQGAPSTSTSIASGGNSGGTNTVAGGAINYNGEISPKARLNSNYIYGDESPLVEVMIARNNLLPDTSYFFNSKSQNLSTQKRHTASVGFEIKPDSATEISLSSSVGFNHSNLDNFLQGISLSKSGVELNNITSKQVSQGDNFNTGIQFFLGRRLRKQGRLFTFSFNASNGEREAVENNRSDTRYADPSGTLKKTLVDQLNLLSGHESQLSLSTNWTEPINKFMNLRVSYGLNSRNSKSFRDAFNKDSLTGKYSVKDTIYTNRIKSTSIIHIPAAYLDLTTEKIIAFLGMSIQHQTIRNTTIGPAIQNQAFKNLFPSANVTYQLPNFASIMFNYNGMTQQPTIDQLNPSPNNTNTLYIQHGNPDLKPAFTHNLTLNVQQMSGQQFWNLSIGWAATNNLIIEETWLDSVQHSRPINSDGNTTFTSNANYFIAWKRGHASFRLSLGASTYLGNNTSFADKQKNTTKFSNISQRASFSITYKNLLTIQPLASVSINKTKYSLSNTNSAKYLTKSFSVSAQLNYPTRLNLEQFWCLTSNPQTGPSFSKTIQTWNAAATYYVTKNKKLMARLTVFDILNQNTAIRRITSSAFIEDQQTNALQRYGHLSVIWQLREF